MWEDRSPKNEKSRQASVKSLIASPHIRTLLRYLICGLITSCAACLLSKERFGEIGGAIALMLIGIAAWFCGSGPGLISPFILIVVASLTQPSSLPPASEFRALDVINLGVLILLFGGIGWGGELRRKALADLREREQRLRDEARNKDRFLATLAHELRNPLAPLRTGAELLRMQVESGLDPTVVREIHAVIHRQVEHMVRLVDDLLDLGRINTGKIELRREIFSSLR